VKEGFAQKSIGFCTPIARTEVILKALKYQWARRVMCVYYFVY